MAHLLVLTAPAFAERHNVIAILADDYGWADASWHRPPGYAEVKTPQMQALVDAGVELDRFYAFKFACRIVYV